MNKLEKEESKIYDAVSEYKTLINNNKDNFIVNNDTTGEFFKLLVLSRRIAKIASKYDLNEKDRTAINMFLDCYLTPYTLETQSDEYNATIAQVNDNDLNDPKLHKLYLEGNHVRLTDGNDIFVNKKGVRHNGKDDH